MKAYDTVQWDFINNVLKIVGFPDTMVRWIMECVTTPRFSVNIYGELNGYFPGAGLRQGDPMSEYILFLVMEAFSGLLDSAITDGKFQDAGRRGFRTYVLRMISLSFLLTRFCRSG